MRSTKIVSSLFVAGAFIASAVPSLAIVSLRPSIRADRVEAKTTLSATREVARVTSTQARLDFRRQQLTKIFGVIKKNLETRFTYLSTTLKTQVQAKIDAKKAAGKDVAEATAKMAEFSTAAYTTDMTALTNKYTEMLASTDPKRNLGELNKLAVNVRHDLNTMKQTLMQAFRLAIRAK